MRRYVPDVEKKQRQQAEAQSEIETDNQGDNLFATKNNYICILIGIVRYGNTGVLGNGNNHCGNYIPVAVRKLCSYQAVDFASASGVKIGIFTLIGMRLRR